MAKREGLRMTIEQMWSCVVEVEKYLNGLSVWQSMRATKNVLQAQTETVAFKVMVGVLKRVLADAVEVDHLSATTASRLGTWPMNVITPWGHILVGNHSHFLQPKGSVYTH